MDDQATRRLARIWDEAGPALEAVGRRELEAMTDADVRAHVDALFTNWRPADSAAEAGSGLVEQQRWFARARRRP